MIEIPEMTSHQLFEYLSQPLIAKLATVNPDGSPQLSPIWFHYDQGTVLIATYEKARKISNIKRNSMVSLLIDSTDGGIKLKGVLMKGKAEIIRGGECKRVEGIIYNKYLTKETVENDAVAAAFKRLALGSEDSVCIRIMPEKLTSWDYTRMKVDGMRVGY
jgi:PPOX class probable F420-dependent enzyme